MIFTGHIKFSQILAYYRCADIFLCMSEHEGFCVPLLEAMYFGIPVIARDAPAIAGTLNGSGFLLQDNNPIAAAEVIDRVISDEGLRATIVENQKKRLRDFDNTIVEKQFLGIISDKIRSHGLG